MMSMSLLAQEKKAFTLEDVIPGGSNYYNLVPKNMSGLKWWGDVCIRTDVDDIKTIDKGYFSFQKKALIVDHVLDKHLHQTQDALCDIRILIVRIYLL